MQLATKLFHPEAKPSDQQGAPPFAQDELIGPARRVYQALLDTPVERGSCANPLCTVEKDGQRMGGAIMADADVDHVQHAADTITICPFFFHSSHSLSELILTWLHEAGHVARIDEPPPGVPYEHPPNCYQQRGDFPGQPTKATGSDACPAGDIHNVDNWAHFIDLVAFA
jgi:hypothetical protein